MPVDERGVPMSIVVTGANRHDVSQLDTVPEQRVLFPNGTQEVSENLCADAGYVGEPAREIIVGHGYVPHVRPRGEERLEMERNPHFKPRRWIVEVSHSWFNRFRKLLVRYEKTRASFLALHHLAAAIIALRVHPESPAVWGGTGQVEFKRFPPCMRWAGPAPCWRTEAARSVGPPLLARASVPAPCGAYCV